MLRALLLCLLALCTSAPALAAEQTEVLMMGHADLGLRYDGNFILGRQTESRMALNSAFTGDFELVDVASYTHIFQEVAFAGEVGIVPGLEFHALIPYRVHDNRRFSMARSMGFDPSRGVASFAAGSPLPDDQLGEVRRGGFGDIRLGISGSPWNESFDNPSFGTFTLDFTVKIPSAPRYFKVQSSDLLGFGTGAVDVQFGGGFSKRWKTIDPYIWGEVEIGGKFKEDLTDSNGQVVTDDAEMKSADRFTIMLGTEAIAMENPAIGTKFAADIRIEASYISPAKWWAGAYLHEIAPNTEGLVVEEDEYLRIKALVGLYVTVQTHFKLQVGTSLGWDTPHILEGVDRTNYIVRNGAETFRIGAFFQGQGSF